MNGIISLENTLNFPISTPEELDYSSDLLVEESDKISERLIDEKFAMLKSDIGEGLFNKLSYEERIFMIETADSIDFGHTIDLDVVAKEIKNYEP